MESRDHSKNRANLKIHISKGFLLILIFFSSFINLFGQYKSYKESLDRAIELLDKKQYEEAINVYNRTLKFKAPNGVNLGWLGMAKTYFVLKKYNEAIICYNNLLEQAANPTGQCQLSSPTNYNGVKYCYPIESFASLHEELGISYENIGNTEMALNSYTAAISINPTSDLFKLRGNIYSNQGKIQEAFSDFKQAINKETSVEYKIITTNRLIQYCESNNDYKLLYDFLKDIRYKNAEQYNKFALASYKLEKYEDADIYYNEALRLQPSLAIDVSARQASQAFIAEKKRKEQQDQEEVEALRIVKIKSAQIGDKLLFSDTWSWRDGIWVFHSSGSHTMMVTFFIERIEGDRYQLRAGDISSSDSYRYTTPEINGVKVSKGDIIWARPLNGKQWVYGESY